MPVVRLFRHLHFLSDKYIQLTGLDRKIQDAKSLDDLKKCLTDTKTFWQEVVDSCKYVQSRYMLFQTNEAYLKLNQVATELDSFVDSEELKNAKNSLTSSNTEFTNYYSQMLKKSQSDMNSSYADLQSNVTKYSKVLGDTEASLAKVIQKASE